ncbi:YdeI/OmpD-associated family protein [Nocardia sp. NBC_00416]|uniref:YdeI/OmpD-associated family protein n=1 Tax=Nocardia sp. NBC_00416 TaxID=2975991 RepID=UPI002E1E8E2A
MTALDETPALTFGSTDDWETWLSGHHDTSTEVWLKIAKKNSPTPTVTIDEALDIALCFGWIDSHRRGLDADHYLQRYSPRRRRSPWSLINRAKAEALEHAGRMRAPGRAAIAAAVADGRWPDPRSDAG